ncbi:MAG: hypothetical protein HC800_01165 [Phormidesmis sp. RL_2_1]|nr:hypothetical protein [Phormidesmis sp. RL_2_1]
MVTIRLRGMAYQACLLHRYSGQTALPMDFWAVDDWLDFAPVKTVHRLGLKQRVQPQVKATQ